MKVKINDRYFNTSDILVIGELRRDTTSSYTFKVMFKNGESIIISSRSTLDAYKVAKFYRNELVNIWAERSEYDIDLALEEFTNENKGTKKGNKGGI